jgi:hypothetical protein|tara:strand:- start:126 stop:263 length:138 start_codon:yes stop_codon:yes gene_type:complete
MLATAAAALSLSASAGSIAPPFWYDVASTAGFTVTNPPSEPWLPN